MEDGRAITVTVIIQLYSGSSVVPSSRKYPGLICSDVELDPMKINTV